MKEYTLRSVQTSEATRTAAPLIRTRGRREIFHVPDATHLSGWLTKTPNIDWRIVWRMGVSWPGLYQTVKLR